MFAILVAFTAHLPVGLPGGVSVSPGLFVCMAALVVFVSKGSLLGAAAVCSLALVHVNDFRRDRWGWIPFNAGLSFLSFLAAAAVLGLTRAVEIAATPLAVLAMVPSAVAYLVVAWTLITLSYLCEGTRQPREVLEGLVPAGIEIFPFAVLGFLVGRLYLELGVGALVLIFVPILIVREVFRSYMRITEARDETVHMLIRALESKDRYTAGHAERVAKYAGYIGEEMNLSPRAQGAVALRRADARHRQARRAEPDPQQAREADRGRVRPAAGARDGRRADARATSTSCGRSPTAATATTRSSTPTTPTARSSPTSSWSPTPTTP